MGTSQSKTKDEFSTNATNRFSDGLKKVGEQVRKNVDDEVGRRLMIQREVQLAINVAKARDNIQIFGSAWALLVSGASIAKMAGKPVPPATAVPIVAGGLFLGNLFDMAYGNKLARVNREAEHILENERARLVPLKQAPMARFYTDDEKAGLFDAATPAGLLWPSSMFSRAFVPPPSSDIASTSNQKSE